jgi:hypothetical protein
MSNVVELFKANGPPPPRPTEPVLQRLAAISDILCALDASTIKSPDEMLRALWMLDVANRCIQLILGEFRTAPDREQLVRQSDRIVVLIELARERLTRRTSLTFRSAEG